jgi:hypothetical protein
MQQRVDLCDVVSVDLRGGRAMHQARIGIGADMQPHCAVPLVVSLALESALAQAHLFHGINTALPVQTDRLYRHSPVALFVWVSIISSLLLQYTVDPMDRESAWSALLSFESDI